MKDYKLILKKAFKEVEEQELREIPAESEIDYQFSPQFEKKMRKLIKAQKYGCWKCVNTTAKKIAVFLIAVGISFTYAMSVDSSRNTIIKFVETKFEEYTDLFSYVNENDVEYVPETIEIIYTIPNLPENLKETSYYANQATVHTEWKDINESTNMYYALYQYISGTPIAFDTEGTTMKKTKINGYLTYTYAKEWYCTYIWDEKGYVFSLTVPNKSDKKFIKSVIGNLIEK